MSAGFGRRSVVSMRRTALICTLTLITVASAAVPAQATFPGRNGPIVFRRVDPASGLGTPLLQARPNGTHVFQMNASRGFFSDWRADGRRLAFDFFDASGNEQIAAISPDGSGLRAITSGVGIHEVPSWSPDGRQIVFDFSPLADSNAPGFETHLWTMRDDGTHAAALPLHPAGFDVEPRYSPDGRWIAFDRLRFTKAGDQLQASYIVSATGGQPRRLTRWSFNAEHPTWSPDSRWVIYNSPQGTIQQIHPNGSGRRTILRATPRFGGHKPWFSPDGKRILFTCALTDAVHHTHEDICVMRANGSHITDITNTPTIDENWPSWGPAPKPVKSASSYSSSRRNRS